MLAHMTKENKYPWLNLEDKRRHMTDAEILREKLLSRRLIAGQKRKRGIFDKD